MKILHVLDHSLPLQSGYSFRSRNIILSQQEINIEPVIVTSSKHESFCDGAWQQKEVIEGMTHYRTGKAPLSGFPFIAELSLINKLSKKIIEVVLKEKPDLIHCHSPILTILAALYCKNTHKLPIIYEIRSFWEDAAVDHGTYAFKSFKYNLTKSIETFTCKKADKVIAICSGIKKDLILRGIDQEKIGIVPNAISIKDVVLPLPSSTLQDKWNLKDSQVVGFIGSFYHYEGLDLLISAASQLKSKGINLKFLLIGGGPSKDALRLQAEELGVSDSVIFTGRVPHDEVPDYYSIIDVLVFPRRKIRLTDCVTPLKPLEAMGMKKAIIASDVGGHKELINHGVTGTLVKADSVEAITKSLTDFAKNPQKFQKTTMSGFSWVTQERTWQNNALTYLNTYKFLTERHGI